VAELNGAGTLVREYVWGTDLSGSWQGAGGVGGLLWVLEAPTGPSITAHYAAYDGNGNVMGLVNATDGTWSARYEYGPFGEVVRATGTMAAANPFRWSTKIQDEDSGLNYYGYRYYSAAVGRWLGRDLIGEWGGVNLICYTSNRPIFHIDPLGLDDIFGYPHWPPALPPSMPYYPPYSPSIKPGYSSPPDDVMPQGREGLGFHVIFSEQTKYRTGVQIRFDCHMKAKGEPMCKRPMLTQIAISMSETPLMALNNYAWGDSDWHLDVGREQPYFPFYGDHDNPQNGSLGSTTIFDNPGLRRYFWIGSPFTMHQSFETCAVCTDDGPGRYWIIGCVSWGHAVGPDPSKVSRWGNGINQRPLPPSEEFLRLFPSDVLRP
jgi:RHS repeat-associated protein